MKITKFINGIFLLLCSIIGGGVIALPMVSVKAGIVVSSLLLVILCTTMIVTGLLLHEVTMALDSNACSLSSMAKKTMGSAGKVITRAITLFLLYSILAAYMAGVSSLISNLIINYAHISVPPFISAFAFLLVFGGVIFSGTHFVAHANGILTSIKLGLLIATITLLLPSMNFHYFSPKAGDRTSVLRGSIAAAPIILQAFSCHFIIPSIRVYIGNNLAMLKTIIISGLIISFIIYFGWIMAILGVVPPSSLSNSPAELVNAVKEFSNSSLASVFTTIFFNITMAISFLVVGLSLFDFLADALKRSNTNLDRAQTSALAFIPPLIFAIFYPEGFLIALKYASVFTTILFVIIPPIMVYNLRKDPKLKPPYRVFGGNILLGIIISIGITVVAIQLFLLT